MDTHDENPTETAAPEGEVPADSGSEPAEHTAESAENQGISAKTQALLGRIDRRINDIQSLMREKERQQLLYVYDKIPKPYYNRWKAEANDIFALTVHIRRRRARAQKAG